MTRRERHLRIIESFGDLTSWRAPGIDHAFRELVRRRGFAILTDEAVEELVRLRLAELKFRKKIDRQNRDLRSVKLAMGA